MVQISLITSLSCVTPHLLIHSIPQSHFHKIIYSFGSDSEISILSNIKKFFQSTFKQIIYKLFTTRLNCNMTRQAIVA